MRFPCKVLSFCHLLPAKCFLLTITRDEQFVHVAWCYESYSRAKDGKDGMRTLLKRPPACLLIKRMKGQVFVGFCTLLKIQGILHVCALYGVQLGVSVSWCVAWRWEPGALCKCLDREQPLPQQPPTPPSSYTNQDLDNMQRAFLCYFRLEVFRLPCTTTAERDHNTISVQQKTQLKKILLQASILDVGYCQIITATQTTHTTYSPHSHSIPMSLNIVVFIFERLCSQ